ncbi:MAG: site-specific integrase [Bacilli bacterium]|nr:site-specific integrase [Methanobrevibacter sp.]MBR1748226.1 site-specific integrase [Bacilli bacterium]
MNMKTDEELLEYLKKTRNIGDKTLQTYQIYIKEYSKVNNNKRMVNLIKEAENEEEEGIRWKHRTLKKRLLNYRAYLYENHAYSTAKVRFSKILTVYRHFDIEVHKLPPINTKNDTTEHISFRNLPDKDIISKSLEISNTLMSALILFISSSGCARAETLSLTVQDFIDSTQDYHNSNDIYEVINQLKDRDDIIPMFYVKRIKTNKYYFTFCSPEATTSICNYLLSLNKKIHPNDKLFQIHDQQFITKFQEINDKLNLGKVGKNNRFRSHMLRKFHASSLMNDGLTEQIIDSLQGRGRDSTHRSYFMDNPEKLREKYIEHLDCLTILSEVNNLDMKSPEFVKMECELESKNETIKNYESEIDRINERQDRLEKMILGGIDSERLGKLNKLL